MNSRQLMRTVMAGAPAERIPSMPQLCQDTAVRVFEPDWIEGLEIGLWLVALAAGITAAVLFAARQKWYKGLIVAAAAVAILFVLTFVQPAIWVRITLDLVLIGGTAWAWRK